MTSVIIRREEAQIGPILLKGVVLHEGKAWLTQSQIAELYGKGRSTIAEHLLAIEQEKEVVGFSDNLPVQTAGGLQQVLHYSEDAIVAVGFRVRSERGTEFRIWARNVLLGKVSAQNANANVDPMLAQLELFIQQRKEHLALAAMADALKTDVSALREEVSVLPSLSENVAQMEARTKAVEAKVEQFTRRTPANTEINDRVQAYAKQNNVSGRDVWKVLHRQVRAKYGIATQFIVRYRGESTVAAIRRLYGADTVDRYYNDVMSSLGIN